ncbi:uncharacterized protein BKA55DRAFT_567040 [Fusarium redolens]|uniref:Uncharacterized protein n=1 Tax=Fusarium redolens TaxID=48865 RepID=A0A9P9HAS1_FUSRE|nr:uncharacterized protein BKA55DRAFT_567040 [Fusarium redolens]KAH7254116.1 hypothetical protein BKA55DRAFT_567040 [Fusarium redolens]
MPLASLGPASCSEYTTLYSRRNWAEWWNTHKGFIAILVLCVIMFISSVLYMLSALLITK